MGCCFARVAMGALLVLASCGGRVSNEEASGEGGCAGETEQGGSSGDNEATEGGHAGLGEGGGATEGGHAGLGEGGGSAGADPVSLGGDYRTVECPDGQRIGLSGPACGDGQLELPELCDDGNTVSGDGCDARCRVESDWVCATEGRSCSRCGNCLVEQDEECDDGNTAQGDGCSPHCEVEASWHCEALRGDGGERQGSGCVPTGPCGDGMINVYGEVCDDGNSHSSDGCSADCRGIEPGFVCHEPGLPCQDIVTSLPFCGDGSVQPEYGEECDDGINDGRLGGCSADCMTPYCGDGQLQPEYGEICDPGGGELASAYLGCSLNCSYPFVPASYECSVFGPYCGDGVIEEEFEECDDGVENGYDGHCELDCTEGRSGFCGDQVLDEGYEECDDGNGASCDGCSSFCHREIPLP